jgi:hypothetical protein
MTQEEISKWKAEYKRIVYQYSLIRDNEEKLKQLHAWDKNGSHDKAIIQRLDQRKELKEQLTEMLKGKTYDEWKLFSKHLIKVTTKYYKVVKQKEDLESTLNHLTF